MAYFAKLKDGVDYRFDTITFVVDQEVEVNEAQYNYLKELEVFEVREDEANEVEVEEGIALEELTKEELLSFAKENGLEVPSKKLSKEKILDQIDTQLSNL